MSMYLHPGKSYKIAANPLKWRRGLQAVLRLLLLFNI